VANDAPRRIGYARSAEARRPSLLDTVADSGDQGNVDRTQFLWLDAELSAAEARREVVVVFGHHPIASMTNAAPDVHLGTGSCSAVP
jgi:3',5'-cyclic AMP phosphodiesterase CpdA